MGTVAVAKQGMDRKVFRRNKAGEIVQVDVAPDEYKAPSPGQYQLRLTGCSDSFEINGQYGVSEMIRLEWVVVSGNKADNKGRRFSDMYPLHITPKSKLGKIIAALGNEEIDLGRAYDVTDYFGRELVSMVKQTVKTNEYGTQVYANVDVDYVEPVSDEPDDEPEDDAPPARPAGKPRATAKAASNGNGNGGAFDVEDDI